MFRTRLMLAGSALALAIATIASAIYMRDGRTALRASAALDRLDAFCRERGRLPDGSEFAALLPDLNLGNGWFYWPVATGRRARLQYPMASTHPGAPGTRRISEFTATTYAYEAPIACAEPPPSRVVQDPYREVWEDEGSVAGLIRFFLDLNGDQQPELFVGAKALVGGGGGTFRVFRKTGDRYAPLGELFAHPRGIEVLRSQHAGYFDLRYCGALSAAECTLVTYVFNGTAYEKQPGETVIAVTDPRRGRPASTHPQESGLELTWK